MIVTVGSMASVIVLNSKSRCSVNEFCESKAVAMAAIVAVSVRSVLNSSHLSSFKHELVALLKASLNLILSEVSRYVALIIHIVDLV